jgi:ribosomal subunit interface protein
MKITIKKTANFNAEISEYTEKKFSPLDKFIEHFEEAGEAELRIEISRTSKHHKNGQVFQTVASLSLPKKVLRAEEYAEDIRTAIDQARNTLRSEIEKYKTQYMELNKKKLAK